MTRKNEDDFVNEGLSPDEQEALSASPEPEEVEDEPAPVGAAGDVAEEPEAKPEPKPQMVDVRAVQEARAAEREMREKYRQLEERTNGILQYLNQQQQPPEDPWASVNVDRDPIGAVNFVVQRQREAELQQQRQQAEWQQQQAAARQTQEIIQAVDDRLTAAANADPETKAAFDYAVKAYEGEIALLGYTGAAAQAAKEQMLTRFALHIAERGLDPAEFTKNLARTRGFQYNPQPAPNTQANLAALQQRQTRHMSLSSVSGGEAPKGITAADLANMSERDYKKFISTAAGRAKADELMGL